MTRDEIATVIVGIAPERPPCFPGEETWLEWLVQDAAEVHRPGRRESPIHFTRNGMVFNRRLNFCEDCTKTHRMEQKSAGKCKPLALLQPEAIAA